MSKRKKPWALLIVLLAAASAVFFARQEIFFDAIYANHNDDYKLIEVRPRSFRENVALDFLKNKLEAPNGLIFYTAEENTPELFSISESMGQAMEYAALSNDAELLDYYAKIIEQYFLDPEQGYYYWRIDVNKDGTVKNVSTSSALVDDLRLLRAYFIAHHHHLGDYTDIIRRTSNRAAMFDVENGYPRDYYDGKSRAKANHVSLFYLDTWTMKMLSDFDSKWTAPYENARKILREMPEQKYGFYPYLFETSTKKYVYQKSTNMVENLYTALFAFHAGKDTQPFLRFLREQVKSGRIVNHYQNETGEPVTADESAAVYALSARFFALHKETEAARWCYRRTVDFMIDKGHDFYGGFGQASLAKVYAFDQLEVMLMMRMVDFYDENSEKQ